MSQPTGSAAALRIEITEADALGISVVAEGIETAQQRRELLRAGVVILTEEAD